MTQGCDCEEDSEIAIHRTDQADSSHSHARIDDLKVNTEDRQPIVRLSTLEWENLVAAEEMLTLIGRFSKGMPSLDIIMAKLRLGLHLEGEMQIVLLNQRTILLRFELERDCRRVWMRSHAIVCPYIPPHCD
nr:TMV resistance protein N-like [Ipomoea batatas]GMC76289.1 TMV resistance protein N-like [Ipomoea batatas]